MSPRRHVPPGPTDAERTTAEIRGLILDGRLAPGEPLREDALAERFNRSRHTIRRALARLVAERLLVEAPYKGVRVSRPSSDDIAEMQILRGALEAEAVRLLRQRHGDHWPAEVLSPIEAALEQFATAVRTRTRIFETHLAFHETLVAAAGISRITEQYQYLRSEMMMLLRHVHGPFNRETVVAVHRRYLSDVQHTGPDAVRHHLADTAVLLATHD